ncbi:hypothetical protein PG985_006089 [Apiospora marii]|uniref:Uncharacterized protein n=1 Tax=Apiospora marii TaxID=335849 RepID=A0ABR1S8Y3_9PEZI
MPRRPGPEQRPLGAREFEVLGYAFLCVKRDFPAVDCRLLASLAGFRSAHETVTYWTALKRKVKGFRSIRKLDDFTFREVQVAGYAWQCIPAYRIPKVKAKRLVELGLYDTTEVATEAWGLIVKKLHVMEENDDSDSDPEPAAPAAPVARRKRNTYQEGDGEAGGSAAKRRRTSRQNGA